MSEVITQFTKKDHPYKRHYDCNWDNSYRFTKLKSFSCCVCNTWSGPSYPVGSSLSDVHVFKIKKISYIVPMFHKKCRELFILCPPTN